MKEKAEGLRRQSEFWFVFNNDMSKGRPALDSGKEDHSGKKVRPDRGNDGSTLLSKEEEKKHRDKLLKELYEFGC